MSHLTLLNLGHSQDTPRIRASAPVPQIEVGFENPEQYFEIFNGLKTASGKTVSYEQAMRCSAVLTCIRILAEDIASLPLILKKKTATGAIDGVDHPAYRLLKLRPNELQTAFELREHMMMDLLLTGHFFNWARTNAAGRLVDIVPIPARAMAFSHELPDGTIIYNCGWPGLPTQFAHWELWRGTILNNVIIGGRSLVLLAREAIGLALAAEEQGARLFSYGVQADTVVEVPEGSDLGTDGKTQLREAFMDRHSGSRNAFMPIIAEGGVSIKRIGLTAQESQYIEARHYQLADVARLFRVPGVMLGLSDKTNTFAAAEQFFQAYAKHTLGPWTRRIEETAARDLLLARDADYFFKHDYSQLLRADQKTRFESYKTAIEAGMMQPQEARNSEDLSEIPGLDFTLVPLNYSIVRDGKVETPAQPPANPQQTPAKQPQTQDQPLTDAARKLAKRTADALVKSECRQFARMRVSEAAKASFAAWHLEKVMECTGASAEAAAAYSTWRHENNTAHEEATNRLVNLSLEA